MLAKNEVVLEILIATNGLYYIPDTHKAVSLDDLVVMSKGGITIRDVFSGEKIESQYFVDAQEYRDMK